MRIGIIIGRIGGVDGVALETEKWIEVLKRMGHEVFLVSGQYQGHRIDPETETLVPEMSFHSPESYWSQKKAFFAPDTNPQELIEHINLYSKVIYRRLMDWATTLKIELIISENASSLPSHLEMGLAIKNTIARLGIPAITHDHDFAWERGKRYVSPHQHINEFIEEVFPLRLPNNFHAVINTNARETLREKFNRESIIVPNVMNFDIPFGEVTDKNHCLHEYLGFDCEKDILLFQVTRIVSRKAIEVAIKLIYTLRDKNIKLVITGSAADDEGNVYYNKLVNLIHDLKVGDQVRFASHLFHSKGLSGENGDVQFSLSDAYAQSTACTYFSTYEGFGNAFVEAVLAKKPIFVNNYKPVYWPDIGSKGFRTVMLEENDLTKEKTEEMREIIMNKKLVKEIGEYNFELGKKYFSYDTLEEKLELLIRKVT